MSSGSTLGQSQEWKVLIVGPFHFVGREMSEFSNGEYEILVLWSPGLVLRWKGLVSDGVWLGGRGRRYCVEGAQLW